MLEAMQYTDNAFVTLTYSDEAIPLGMFSGSNSILPTLVPRDLQLFMKRLRKECPTKLRFFAVGEYGDETFRPHYHIAAFNFPRCYRGETKRNLRGRCIWSECCDTCRLVGTTWGKGDIEVRNLDAAKCEYVARYTIKKMTKGDDARLLGRHPEFSRQSNRPGIGAPSVARVAEVIRSVPRLRIEDIVDVPSALMLSGKPLPLGRYMRAKLRLALGLPEGTPDEVLHQAWHEQVLPLLKISQTDKETVSLREAFRKANAPHEASLEARQKRYGKGKL